MADENAVEATETEATPAEAPENTGRVSLTWEEFYDLNEEVATGDNPTIAAIAEATGYAESTVKQKRSEFNTLFKPHDLRLTDLPKGGRPKANPEDLTDIAARLIAKREAVAGEVETETKE